MPPSVPPSPSSTSRFLRRLLFHFFYFFLAFVLATAFTALLGWAGAAMVMALLWLPLLWAAPALWNAAFKDDQDLHWVAIPLVLVTAMGVCLSFPTLPSLLAQSSVPSIRASEIGKYPDTPAFHFLDAQVRTAYAHRRVARRRDGGKSGGTTTVYFTVAPITDAGWTKDQPIPAWAVCDGNEASNGRCPYWGRANAGAVMVLPYGEDGLQQAVLDAGKKFGLQSTPAPRLLQWTPSVEGEVRRRAGAYAASLFGVYLAWAVIFAFGHLRRRGESSQ